MWVLAPTTLKSMGAEAPTAPILTWALLLDWTKKLKIPELSCPKVLALCTTRLDPNFQDMGSTRPEKTQNSGQNGRLLSKHLGPFGNSKETA